MMEGHLRDDDLVSEPLMACPVFPWWFEQGDIVSLEPVVEILEGEVGPSHASESLPLESPARQVLDEARAHLALLRGRVNESLHRPDVAAWSYQLVLNFWSEGDPEVQPWVEEARAGLARLGVEPRQ